MGGAEIVAVEPYRGRYPQWFAHSLTVRSPHTESGTIEVAAGVDDWEASK